MTFYVFMSFCTRFLETASGYEEEECMKENGQERGAKDE